MRAHEIAEFDDIEALLTGGKQRNWIFFGLIVSLALHLALCFWFYRTRFQSAEALFVEPQQTALDGNELATSTTIKKPNTFTSKIPGDSAGPNKNRAPGFSDLDQLLSQKGPLGSGTKLRMPDDQLFQYDSSELQGSAIAQLQKLGTLIKRNSKATFTVEGYTDSFGPPDYNLDLSQRRAEGVKAYLVNVMGINPA